MKVKRDLYIDSENKLYIKLVFNEPVETNEYTSVYDASKEFGLPEFTLLTSEDDIIYLDEKDLKKIGYGYIFRDKYIDKLKNGYLYMKKSIIEKHICKEALKNVSIKNLKKFHEKWGWYF